jgi:hypothetical protein
MSRKTIEVDSDMIDRSLVGPPGFNYFIVC